MKHEKPKYAIITDIDGTLNAENNPWNHEIKECAFNFIQSINKKHDTKTYYITKRWHTMRPRTKKWLKDKNFPDSKDLHLDTDINTGEERWNKIVELCKKSNADQCIFIDNNDTSLATAQDNNDKFIEIFDKPLIIIDPRDCDNFNIKNILLT